MANRRVGQRCRGQDQSPTNAFSSSQSSSSQLLVIYRETPTAAALEQFLGEQVLAVLRSKAGVINKTQRHSAAFEYESKLGTAPTCQPGSPQIMPLSTFIDATTTLLRRSECVVLLLLFHSDSHSVAEQTISGVCHIRLFAIQQVIYVGSRSVG